jgi:hypothetical protein
MIDAGGGNRVLAGSNLLFALGLVLLGWRTQQRCWLPPGWCSARHGLWPL